MICGLILFVSRGIVQSSIKNTYSQGAYHDYND